MANYDFNVCTTDHRIIPMRNPVTIAENDHNSDILKIRLPRKIGLLDVIQASHILISWESEESSGLVEIDTDYMTFEGKDHIILLWSPDNNMTNYNGIITFDLTIRNVGSENVIAQNWSAAGGLLLCLATIDAESKLYEDMISQYDEVLTAMTKGPVIRDNYWWTYNWDKKTYINTGVAASGNPGPAGPAGERGERGERGETGPAGADGKTPVKGVDYWTDSDKSEILSASTKPPVIKNGNWYVYDVESKEYIDTLTAATGPAGQDGKNGVDGQPGECGPAGEQGERGERGPAGEPGAAGPAGERGEIGERGPAGADGHTPIRGTDYWTAEDQSAIITEILTYFIDAENKAY